MQNNKLIAVVDIEIANAMTKETWDNKKADICLIGALLVQNNQIQSIVQIPRTAGMSKEDYASLIKKLMDSLQNAGYSLFALNAPFEAEAIEAYCSQKYTFNEIKGNLRGSKSSKDNLYVLLEKRLKLGNIYDILGGNAKLCPDFYQLYLSSGDMKFLQDIISHNLNCLLKEHRILQNIKWLEEKAIIDEGGFIMGWKEQ
jgi:hypothetical protein